ncbi:MAG: Glutamyl aminopeptidase [Akkermansiaceae bacterium]|nr:Glutamyl aminopeptidase [Akkermansiaceae bacterium]
MHAKAVSLLQELTEAHSVSGHEEEVRSIFARELREYGALSTDRTGSVFCELPGAGPRVLIAGHMDEVGFLVQNITHDGFLQIQPVGGWWEHVLLAQRVEIRTRSGKKILGVISSKPPHFLPEAVRKQVMTIDQMFVDVGGASRHEVESEFGISLGDPVAPLSAFTAMEKPGYYLAKAFDNRVGMAGAIQAGQILAGGPHPNHLILAGTVQEEVGLRGAKTAAHFVKPDVAIVLEGPPADDTPGFSRADSQGRLGGGVQIRLYDPSAIMNPRLAELAIRTAREENIPHQVTVRRSGGTDAGSFHLANEGIPSVVLGVPARYIHSHNAVIDIDDQLHLVALTVALARRLDEAVVKGLTQYL